MSHVDHEWARELLPAHLAGGLSAEERARLEAHASACAECIAELDALRRFDRGLDEMFAPVRPSAGLEERVIRAVRRMPVKEPKTAAARFGYGVAAIFLLGLVGFGVLNYAEEGSAFGWTESVAAMVLPEGPQMKRAFRANSAPPAPPAMGMQRSEELAGLKSQWATPDFDRLEYADQVRSKMLAQSGVQDAEARLKERLLSAGEMARAKIDSTRDDWAGVRGRSNSGGEGRGKKGEESVQNYPSVGGGVSEGKDSLAYRAYSIPPPAGAAELKSPPPLLDGSMPAAPSPPPDSRTRSLDLSRVEEAKKMVAKADPAYFKPAELGPHAAPAPAAAPPLSAAEKVVLLTTKTKPLPQDPRAQDPQPSPRKIIRSGEMEFEVDSFDSSVLKIDTIAAEEGGVIATVNSDKLQNGKVRGTVVIKVPPDHLGTLIIKLRALGDLKTQKLGSEDVTKQYTDLESRLRAARTMEERLIRIIKEGKGEIKDLLLAEKELGEWRTKIEMAEGEKRYYDNLVALSTLTITLSEKEIRAAYGLSETERVEAHVESEDVETAYKDLLAAVAEAKGRVTKSELKKLVAGQFSATVNFEVAPDKAIELRARLKQLGNVSRLDVSTLQETQGGKSPTSEVKVKRSDSQFFVSIYNLSNIAPRETVHVSLACVDTEAVYKAILGRVEKAGGVVRSSTLSRQKSDQTTGVVSFVVKAEEAEAVLLDVRAQGEVMSLQVTENPDLDNVTRSRRAYIVNLSALGTAGARETTRLQLAAKDVSQAYRTLSEAIRKAEGRVLSANLNENDRRNITATLTFDVRRTSEKAVQDALADSGQVYSKTTVRQEESQNVVDSKIHVELSIFPVENVPPRETVQLAIEVGGVDSAVDAIQKIVAEGKGRIQDLQRSRDQEGRQISRLVAFVPYSGGRAAVVRMKELGITRVEDSRPNASVPDSDLAVTRLDITLSNEVLVATDSAPWASIKKGFSVSALALSWSLTLVMIGLCFVLPLAAIGWGSWKLVRRMKKAPASTP